MRLFYLLIRRLDAATLMFIFGLYSLLWGLWLMNPAVDSFASTRAFAHLAEIAPEEYWGTVAALIGALKLAALLQPRVTWRQVACGLGFVFWLFIADSLIMANPGSTGTVSAGLALLGNLLALWRLSSPA